MVYQQTNESARLRRQLTEQAIKAAMQNRWEDAVRLNQSIIDLTQGKDTDALNRLGRALMALGRLAEARDAYSKALQQDPANQIARKNLNALQAKLAQEASVAPAEHVDPRLFVEETGKTGVVTLQQPRRELLALMTAGERVYLRRDGNTLLVTNVRGEVLGQVEPRIGLRLIRLMEGGNEYAAAISQITAEGARIIIKETYQHPSNAGRLSFPPSGSEGLPRAYVRDSVWHRDEDEEETAEGESNEAWDADIDQGETSETVRLIDFPRVAERDDLDYTDE